MSSDTITQTLLAQFGELATRNLTAELAEARYEASLPSKLVTLDLAAEQPAEPFPLTAPGMPVPGQDVLRLALAQGAELAWAGKGKDLRLAESDGTLERIYHRLLHSAGQYHLPLSIDQHTAKSLSVVTGHRWDHAVTGPVPADVFVLSKMLGEEEKRAARNFVGPSGELLRDLCDTLRVPGYADWYVTNVFKAEHPQAEAGNSTLKSSWIAEFLPLLHMELRLVRPKYILCIGADALKVLLGKRATLDGMLGRVVEYTYPVGRTADDHREHTALVMACTHPAAVLRTPELETKLQNDLTRWGQLVQGFRPDQPEVDIDHRAIESPAELAALAHEIDRDIVRNTISLDAEWHGDHPENAGAYVRSIQLSWGPKKAAYIHVTHPGGAWRFGGSQAELCAALKQICRGRRLVGQFLLSDMARLLALGLDLRDEFAVAADWQTFMETNLSDRPTGGFDIGLALHAIDETADFGLTAQTLRFTGAPRYDVALDEWKAAYCHTHQIKPKELDGYGECPDDVLVPYGNYDADIPSRLVGLYEELLTCDRFGNNCWEALWMSMRATPAVLEMETTGMLIDRRRVDELSQVYMAARQRLSDEIKQWARWPDFNLQSTYEVREFLFGESLNGKKRVDPLIPVRIRPRGAKSLKIDPAMSTDKRPVPWPEVVRRGETHLKQPSTNKTSLAILAQDNQAVPRTSNRGNGILVDYSPIIMKLRDYRFISQVLKSVLRDPDTNEAGDFILEDGFHTYSGGLPGRICGDGRIRTRISQVKETGRWSSWNPALQNLSKKREADYERVLGDLYRWAIRTIICATPGYLLVEADFTGAELLGMALLSGDATMIAHALRAALPEEHPDYYDIHSNVTVLAFALACPPTKSGLKSVGKAHLRTVAKSVVFGLAYGRGAKAIALALREEGVLVSEADAQRIIDTVLEMYPGLVPFFADCRARALTERWICGCFGRFRRFPQARDFRMQGDIERQAMNFPIQGLVGDAATRACDHLYHYRETHPLVDYRIVMQIHDAILLEVPYGHVGVVMREVLPECMSQAVPIYPTDLAGLPTGAGPYHMGVDVECYQAWGEKMQPHQFLACGLDPELGHWHAAEGGWTRADKPGKLWVGDVTGGGWQALPESTGQVNRSSLG
jgi:uracil-DNA glycosylase family 4